MVDYLIIGGGIIGLSTAWQLQQRRADSSILLLEKEATIRFCHQHDIPVEQCGKLIVAGNDAEHQRMLDLFERASDNGLDVELLDDGQEIETKYLIACGGLMADRLAKMQKIDIDFQIIPYRGEYFQLPPEKNDIVKHLIYPVPNPDLPFLGIHLTRMIDGSVTVGPNALQAWKREGYGRVNFSPRDTAAMFGFSGFWNVLRETFRTGLREIGTSLWRRSYLAKVRQYCPSIELNDLGPYRTGVRAMAVQRDGTLVQDFLFEQTSRSLHVCSAPSPAATSAIPIGKYICDKIPDSP